MKKICCIEDANVYPQTSSCPMVLRSACTHKHSRESSTDSEKSSSWSRGKRKFISSTKGDILNSDNHIQPTLRTSLKQIALKSAEDAYCLLKQKLFASYEESEEINQKYNVNSLEICAKKIHFSNLSVAEDLSNLSGATKLEKSYYSSITESDINITSDMSRKSLARKPVRNQSDSDENSDISINRITRITTSTPYNPSVNNSSGSSAASNMNLSNNNFSPFIMPQFQGHINTQNSTANSHSGESHFTESSQLAKSVVQNTIFDKWRWLIWRCTYLKIIRNVNFDVWLLSKIHNFGKISAIFCMLLPLLLYLFWSAPVQSQSVLSLASEAVNTIAYLPLSLLQYSSEYFNKIEKISPNEDGTDPCSFPDLFAHVPDFSAAISTLSSWFTRSKESDSSITQQTSFHLNDESLTSHEMRLLIQEELQKINLYQRNKEDLKLLIGEELQKTRLLKKSKDEIRALVRELLEGTMSQRSENQAQIKMMMEREIHLQDQLRNLKVEVKSFSDSLQRLEERMRDKETSEQIILKLTDSQKKQFDSLQSRIKSVETQLGTLQSEKYTTFCDKCKPYLLDSIKDHIVMAFKNVIDGDSVSNSRYQFFTNWLNSKFYDREKVLREINMALEKHSAKESFITDENVKKIVKSYINTINEDISNNKAAAFAGMGDYFSEEKIKLIVKQAIMIYDADKTGKVDYALESAGGSVISIRCTEKYEESYGVLSIFGIPLPLWSSSSPRTAIQPQVQPGNCWAFKGSQGYLVIQLSATIYPTGFTVEHIPVAISPTGSIDSAPKNFTVFGLENEKENGVILGTYTFDINGEPLQYFPVMNQTQKPYSYIELQILSNHGNMNFTCLYRFRVHGRPA